MVMPVQFSVVVCTYNRCELLRELILSLFDQTANKDTYEIIVVDNNSTDATRFVVEEASGKGKHSVRYVKEVKQGLSFARNAGAFQSKGDIIGYLDDDSRADRSWVESLCKVYNDFPHVACVGGRIEAVWPVGKPDWLPQSLERNYGVFDLGDNIKEIEYPANVLGGNISVRKEVLLKIGGFRTVLGRSLRGLLSNEEKDFCHRIQQSGGTVMYTPHALVYHKIHPERLNEAFLLRRAYWQGISNVRMNISSNNYTKGFLLKEGMQTFMRMVGDAYHLFRHAITGRKVSLEEKWSFLCNLGCMKENIYLGLFGKH